MKLTELLTPFAQVRLGPGRIRVRLPAPGTTFDEPPFVAISAPPRRILGFGKEALALRERPGVLLINPFENARLAIGDFTIAEQLVKGVFARIEPRKWFRPSRTVVITAEREFEGGLTDIEVRALNELAIGGGGAAHSVVWQGPELTDDQLRRLDFPASGKVLFDSAWRPPRR